LSLSTGYYPYWVATGDVDGDDKLDAVTANTNTDDLSVFRGNGGGGFAPASNYFACESPMCAALGDVDSDGRLDVLTASYTSGAMVLLRGNGTGGVLPPVNYCSGTSMRSIALAELNGDGRLDVVVGGYGSDSSHIAVHFNRLASSPAVSSFGTGTPGCTGKLTLNTASSPNVGNSAFAITGTNAPVSSLGALLFANFQDSAGSDLFGLGVKVHIGYFAATESLALEVRSDASGTSFTAAPIPNNPILAGVQYYVQTFWIEPVGARCTTASLGLVSSRGLDILILP
jgi:hypothetical protein